MIRIPLAWNAIDPTNEPSLKENQKFCSEDLARSGLTPLDIPVLVEPLALVASQFVRGVAQRPQTDEQGPYRYYTIPYFYGDGSPVVDKLNHPLMYRQRTSDKEPRYISPKRALAGDLVTMPYFNPLRLELAERNGLYVIVEGEKKYSKLLLEEKVFGCAIGGKDMWGDNRKLHPLLIQDIIDYDPDEIRIVPDGDWKKQDILMSYSMLVFRLRERFSGLRITIADLSDHRTVDGDRMGIDDYLHAGNSWASVTLVDPEHELLLSSDILIDLFALEVDTLKSGTRIIRSNHSNLEKLFRGHPLYASDELWHDTDLGYYIFQGEFVGFATRLIISLQRYCHMLKITIPMVNSVAEVVCQERKRSPLAEWLKELQWDGIPRIKDLFIQCVQTDGDPEVYRAEAARMLMLQLVARRLEPGCKADNMIIFVGKQGIHKSMFWEELSCGSFSTLGSQLTDKDAQLIFAAKWIQISEELAFSSKRSKEDRKKTLTQTEDTFRSPYTHLPLTYKRSCIFVGNTNRKDILGDSENRRELPIKVSWIDMDWLKANKTQLFAEAVFRYGMGEQWWNDGSKWEDDKAEFLEGIPHEKFIEDYVRTVFEGDDKVLVVPKTNPRLGGKKAFEFKELENAMYLSNIRVSAKLIADSLERMGYRSERVKFHDKQRTVWVKIQDK